MSKAVITNDIDEYLKEIKADEIIRVSELKVDDVGFIREKAYISDNKNRLIVIAAEKFNLFAQNALLKLIEEPPKNVEFLIVTNSKYSLLETILSRVFLEKKFFEKNINFKLEKITNEYILDLLTSNLEKEQIKEMFCLIVKEKELSETQLKIITEAVKMIELNLDKEAIISLVMLSLKGNYEDI